MATNITSEATSGPAERKLMYLIEHGNDFMKIELLRPALSYYERALELSPGNPEIELKIAECKRLLTMERTVIGILAVIGTITVMLFLLL